MLFTNQKYTHVMTANSSDKKLAEDDIKDDNGNKNNIFTLHFLEETYKKIPLDFKENNEC